MKNTLGFIQILAQCGKVISKIIFICCLICGIMCILGIFLLSLLPDTLNISEFIEKSFGASTGNCYVIMALGIVFCAGECVISKISEKYFTNELYAGTPFTKKGAKELIIFGVYTILVPGATVLISEVVYSVMGRFFENTVEASFGDFATFDLGLMLVILGLFAKYTSEIIEEEYCKEEKIKHDDDRNIQ